MRRSVFVFILLMFSAAGYADGGDHVSVTGTEVVQVKPDMAVLSFTVARDHKNADEAKRQVDAAVAKVLDRLKGYDSKALKIISNNLSINKNRNYQTREIVNYSVSMPFEVEIYDLTLQNRVIDDVLEAGVGDINPLAYRFRDENVVYDRAMQAALQAAKVRAEKIAAFYGRGLGPVQTVEDGNFASHSPMPMRMTQVAVMMSAKREGGTQIMVPDHVDYSFTVYVTYTLK